MSTPPTNGHQTSSIPKPALGQFAPGERTKRAAKSIQIRERPDTDIELEALNELHLGEYADVKVTALSVSEARYLVDTIYKKRPLGSATTEIANKMNLYMDTFARFKTRGQIDELEAIFKHYADVLAEFERVQLVTLIPGDWDEAKNLIPSLGDKISNDQLDMLLQDIARVKNALPFA